MKLFSPIPFCICLAILLPACVSNKQYTEMQANLKKELNAVKATQFQTDKAHKHTIAKLDVCNNDKRTYQSEIDKLNNILAMRREQIGDLKDQLLDAKTQRDKQLTQVGDLTVLSQSASENMKETLEQLESKDLYIRYLQNMKSKADSINLALAINLKSVLHNGIDDEDIEIQVDKTVVFINMSDKMLYISGSYNLTNRAHEVLGKIAKIIASRPELEVMVEGYTDNVPIKTSCIVDNWDLSVKRATSVIRTLQESYGVDPNKLIAAGRGEYNTLATNETLEGRAINRRTRIILLPKLNQFYDLLAYNNEMN